MRGLVAMVVAATALFAPLSFAHAEQVSNTVPVGSQPFGVAVDAVAGRVYVTNTGTDSVWVLDATTHAVVTTIAVGSGPGPIALDPARKRAWVANFNEATTTVLDTATNTVVKTVSAGGLGIAVDTAAGRVYAAAGAVAHVLDADTGSLVATWSAPAGAAWWGVAANPVTHRVYVADPMADTVYVLDGTSGATLATVKMESPSRFGLAVDPTTNRLYVASYPAGQFLPAWPLRVVDGATNTVVGSLDMTGFALGVALDTQRQRGYVSHLNTGSLSVVDLSSLTLVETLTVGSEPAGLAFDGARGQVFVANYAGDTVTVVKGKGNAAPVVDSLTLTPTQPKTNDVVSVAVAASDADGDALTYRYQWTRNGADVAGATAPTLDLAVGGNGDRGDSISVRVTISDAKTETTAESVTLTVGNTAPALQSVTVSASEPKTNDVLSVTVAASDVDGDPLTYRYQWTRNGADLAGATASTLDLSDAGNGDKGDRMSVRVTVSDGDLEHSATATAVTVLNTAPVMGTVSVSPAAARTNDTLATSAIASDADGDELTFNYQWLRNGVELAAAAGSSLDLSVAGHGDKGDRLSVRAVASDGTLESAALVSAEVLVENTAPAASVSLSNTAPRHRETLVATVTAHDADMDALTFTYVWKVNGAVVRTLTTAKSQDSFTLERNLGHKGDVIVVEVTANDGEALSEVATAQAVVPASQPQEKGRRH